MLTKQILVVSTSIFIYHVMKFPTFLHFDIIPWPKDDEEGTGGSNA
jgi:hypothetical protein